MTEVELHQTVIEAASWKLASALARRHPEVVIRREHPGGGQYDVLAVRSERGCNVQMNRAGHIHVHGRQDGGEPDWEPAPWQQAIGPDYQEFVTRLETAAGLAPVARALRSTPRVLVYRTLSALANLQILSHAADISMGALDISGLGGGGPAGWLDEFPDLRQAAAKRDDAGDNHEPRFDYWRVKTKAINVAFDLVEGEAWSRGGDKLNLDMTYEFADRSMARLLAAVLALGSPT